MSDPAAGAQIDVTTDDGWRAVSSSRQTRDTATVESVKNDATRGLKADEGEPADAGDTEADAGAQASAAGASDKDEAKADAGKPSDEAKPAPQSSKDRWAKRQAEFQRKINDLRREVGDLERRRAELQGDSKLSPAERTAKSIEATPVKKAEAGEMPVWAEYEAQGKEFAEFERDRAAWDDKRLAAREAKIKDDLKRELEQEQHARVEKERAEAEEKAYFARIDAAREAHEDFDEAVDALGDLRYDESQMWPDVIQRHPQGAEILYYLAKHPDQAKALMGQTWTTGAALGLFESEHPVALTAYLAEHPDETEAILEMSRPRAIRALTLIDSNLGTNAAEGAKSASASPSTAPVTRAKAPLRAVGGTRTSGDSRDPDDLPFGPEYVRRMNERDRQRRHA